MKKIGIISDTHISEYENRLPDEVLRLFKGVRLILHAGDLTCLKVLEDLKAIAPVKAVSGNMDSLKVKKILPMKEIITMGKFRIGLMHGWGIPKNLVQLLQNNFKDNKLDIIVFGHSHSALNEHINGILMFNPGSPTDKLFSTSNSVGIIELSNKIESTIIQI